MAGAFGWRDWARLGASITVETGTDTDGMPTENLFDAQPGLRARLIPVAGVVRLVVDLGATRTAGVITLVNTALDGSESIFMRGSITDPTGVDGAAFIKGAAVTAPDTNRGQVVNLLTADVSVRYVRIVITGIAGSILDIGGLAVQQVLRLNSGMAFGMSEGRAHLGTADRNPFTGAEFRVDGVGRPRYARVTLPTIKSAEYEGDLRALLAEAAPSVDVLWIPETSLSQAEMNLRCIWGGITRPGEEFGIARNRPMLGSMSFSITERM